jgi:hypothetical protein
VGGANVKCERAAASRLELAAAEDYDQVMRRLLMNWPPFGQFIFTHQPRGRSRG